MISEEQNCFELPQLMKGFRIGFLGELCSLTLNEKYDERLRIFLMKYREKLSRKAGSVQIRQPKAVIDLAVLPNECHASECFVSEMTSVIPDELWPCLCPGTETSVRNWAVERRDNEPVASLSQRSRVKLPFYFTLVSTFNRSSPPPQQTARTSQVAWQFMTACWTKSQDPNSISASVTSCPECSII